MNTTRQPIDRPCSRPGCSDPSFGTSGDDAYCTKHRAFVRMRCNAKQDGKTVPTWEELEAALPTDMRCGPCGRQMNWRLTDGRSTVLTLQHDRSGAFRLICQGCNTKHARLPGDTFYELPVGSKWCAGCEAVKPIAAFAVDRSRPGGRKGRCRDCCRAFYEQNRGYWRDRQKRRRAATV